MSDLRSNVFLLLGLLATAPAAPAATLATPEVFGTVLINVLSTENFVGTGDSSRQSEDTGAVHARLTGEPFASIDVDAQMGASNTALLFGRAVGIIRYVFDITSSENVAVPVEVTVAGSASGHASAGASFVVQSSWQLVDANGSGPVLLADDISTPQRGGSFSDDFGRTVTLNLQTNRLYLVELRADAQAAASAVGSVATAHAYVDPFFAFGAGVDTSRFAFRFSAGIGNASPVPLPAPIAMFTLSGVLLWRCRRRTGHCVRTAPAAAADTSESRS